MEIRVRSTGSVMSEFEFRKYQSDLTGASWNETTDDILENLGADFVFEGSQAIGGTIYQHSMRDGVEQIDGKWYTKYILGPTFTNQEDEIAYKKSIDLEQENKVRSQRNLFLNNTDWTQLADAKVDKNAWATYRQSLRDIPESNGFPWSVEWPIKP
jgi:hypothetical protein